jgi:hypothetical protein
MTDEQKKEVERIVNEKINEDLPVVRTEMAKEEAEKLGAEHEFGAKYPERFCLLSRPARARILDRVLWRPPCRAHWPACRVWRI